MDIIKFDIPKNTENCMTKDNPEFCIPKVIPSIDTFIFDERLLYERTPNFITSPTQKEILEILLKDSKYFDTMKIKSLPRISKPPVSRKCDFVGNLMTKCQTFEKDSEVLISTEEVLFKTPVTELDENPMAKALNAPINKIGNYIMLIKLTSKVKCELNISVSASEVVKESIEEQNEEVAE